MHDQAGSHGKNRFRERFPRPITTLLYYTVYLNDKVFEDLTNPSSPMAESIFRVCEYGGEMFSEALINRMLKYQDWFFPRPGKQTRPASLQLQESILLVMCKLSNHSFLNEIGITQSIAQLNKNTISHAHKSRIQAQPAASNHAI